ncbi:MAG TPA: helix-turn-helix domain-containing protein [Desulfosarcina sp.]|nr:helix-turn-helix domain-containing protein [Desulfosarcina sp.]
MRTSKRLSVSEAAALCGVGRTTVGYWVRSKKLYALRQGRSYAIPEEDLIHFLRVTGQKVPPGIGNGDATEPVFQSFKNCWHYWQQRGGRHRCTDCLVFKRAVDDCFCVREAGRDTCPEACSACRYYREVFVNRIGFIHQIDFPAVVFKGLFFWGGNRAWAELCGQPPERVVGMGVEQVVHPDSLAVIISAFKRISLAEKAEAVDGRIFINAGRQGRRAVTVWIFPLRDPEGTFLLLAKTTRENGDGQPLPASTRLQG